MRRCCPKSPHALASLRLIPIAMYALIQRCRALLIPLWRLDLDDAGTTSHVLKDDIDADDVVDN
jgi:hypothetical protein